MYAHYWVITCSAALVLIVGEMVISLFIMFVEMFTTFLASGQYYEPPFEVYWNIPTFMCKRYKLPLENITQHYPIIQNINDDFRGDKIVILYDPGKFPAILQNVTTKRYYLRNHGVPQEGSVFEHLQVFEQHVNELIPDENFSGLAVIDFESWRPIFRQNFGSLQPYKNLSIHIEQQRHQFWKQKRLEKEATKRFEIAGRQFMEQTLLIAKRLRPRANWGYYAFPYCFNGKGISVETCSSEVQKENNQIQWLFDASDVILPSVYMTEKIPPPNRVPMVRGRVAEAIRHSREVRAGPQPLVYVYYRYVYTDTLEYVSELDTYSILNAMKQSGADGVILWGSSFDLNTRRKCEEFYRYFANTLGPVISSLQPVYSVRAAVPDRNF